MLFLAAMYLQLSDAVQPALAALDAGRLADAKKMLERLADEHPREPRIWAALARTYFGLGMAEKAVRAAKTAEAVMAGSPEAQHLLALYYAQSGNRKKAAELECLYAASPKADAAAPARAAMLSAEVGHWEQAITFGVRAQRAGQRPDLIVPMLARAFEATGQWENAIDLRRQLAESLPASEEAQAGYGIVLLRAGRFREAAEHLERSRHSFDRSAQIELALGTAYYAQRRFAEAGSRFLRVIELDPAVHQPYIFLARMIDQIPGRADDFLARAKAWYESGTPHAFAPYVYARALGTAGAPDSELKPLLEAAVARDGSKWEFHFELGQLFERARDYAAAASAYERSISCEAQRPEPHYRLARVYDRLGRPAEARRQRELHSELIGKEQHRAGVVEP